MDVSLAATLLAIFRRLPAPATNQNVELRCGRHSKRGRVRGHGSGGLSEAAERTLSSHHQQAEEPQSSCFWRLKTHSGNDTICDLDVTEI